MEPRERICAALDFPSWERAEPFARAVAPHVGMLKVGLELFAAEGPPAVRAAAALGRPIFLDLKLHDIPNTVKGAAAAAAGLGVDLLTVHAMGGLSMVAAAVEGAGRAAAPPRVVGVTVLTSLDGFSIPPGFAQPFIPALVIAQLALLVESAGGGGIVCAATDLPGVHHVLGRRVFAVTPGIRAVGAPRQDQARVTTVAEAVRLGAGMLVLGRTITAAADPRAALEAARVASRGR